MKNLIYITSILILLVSCSKESDPPTPISPVNVLSGNCTNSTWKYEVILGTPVVVETFGVTYRNEVGNMITDSNIVSTWDYTFTMQYGGNPVGEYPLDIFVMSGPAPNGSNIINTVMINIYKDGVVVQSTNSPVFYCSGGAPPCGSGTSQNVILNYQCTD